MDPFPSDPNRRPGSGGRWRTFEVLVRRFGLDSDVALGQIAQIIHAIDITRSNVLEDDVRLYHVKDGKRTQIASWDGKAPGKVWNELAAEAKGDTFRVFFNGKQVIERKDSTFGAPGKVGLWTKADSVTYFDDLTVSPL